MCPPRRGRRLEMSHPDELRNAGETRGDRWHDPNTAGRSYSRFRVVARFPAACAAGRARSFPAPATPTAFAGGFPTSVPPVEDTVVYYNSNSFEKHSKSNETCIASKRQDRWSTSAGLKHRNQPTVLGPTLQLRHTKGQLNVKAYTTQEKIRQWIEMC